MDNKQPVVISIAGSDNSGGAGIQADIKTCSALGVYAATVITAVTSQNSHHVYGVETISTEMVKSQIDSILETIRPDAIKIGMLPTPEIIEAVADKIKEYGLRNVVVDPVMVATNGDSLTSDGLDMIDAFKTLLFPLADLITPNIPEGLKLMGMESMDYPKELCKKLYEESNAKGVLLKGGHSEGDESVDYLYDGNELTEFSVKRINSKNTHGTGCTLSSAIASGLAKGMNIRQAVAQAKDFVYNAILNAEHIDVAKGPGPLNFLWKNNN